MIDIYGPYLRQYLKEQRRTDYDIEKEMKKAEGWFGVVDGVFGLLAVRRLRDKKTDVWSAFKWSYIVLSSCTTSCTTIDGLH